MAKNQELSLKLDSLKKEVDRLRDADQEQRKEIQDLERKVENANKNSNNTSEEQKAAEYRIIELETENSSLDNEKRELLAEVEELRFKFESAMEESIIIKADLEERVMEFDEQRQRFEMEIKDLQTDLASKLNLIEKLQSGGERLMTEEVNMLPLQTHENIPGRFLQSLSRSFINIKQEFKPSVTAKKELNLSCIAEIPQMVRHMSQGHILGNLKMNDYLVQKLVEQRKVEEEQVKKKEEKPVKEVSGYESNDDENEMEFLNERIAMEVNNILENRRDFILSTLANENFSLELLGKETSKVNSKLLESIDVLLAKVQGKKLKLQERKVDLANEISKIG